MIFFNKLRSEYHPNIRKAYAVMGLAAMVLIAFPFKTSAEVSTSSSDVKSSESSLPKTQQKGQQVSGVVVDANGEPIIGANVVEKGTTNGTITDIDGKFFLSGVSGKTLVVSYIGYISQEVTVREGAPVNVKLMEDTQKLEEVVVVGYGIQKKANLTGSVASVSTEDIQDNPSSNLSNALVGKIAGVLMTQSGGKPGAGSSVTVRAKGTWNDSDPLYVIDGVIRDKFAFDGLDASEVENLSVLKDGASAAIYGARAANGVILVTTKKGQIGKPVISYTGSIGLSDATKIPDTQDAYSQAKFINDYLDVENVSPTDLSYYTTMSSNISRTTTTTGSTRLGSSRWLPDTH